MLIDERIELKWSNKIKKYYVNKGYLFTKNSDTFLVKVNDLQEGCNKKIRLKCDYCNELFSKYYYKYIEGRSIIKKDACDKCKTKKRKDVCKEKYGVENVFQLERVKEKIIETQIDLYGEIYSKTNDRKEKIKRTNLEKYGYENPMQNEEVFTKAKNTCIKKYGVDNPFKNEEIKERWRKNLQNKYNDKLLQNVSQLDSYKEKFKQTSMRKYGVEHPFQSDIVKKKSRQTCLKRYGFKNAMQNIQIKAKAIKTLSENGKVNTSSQQIKIFNILKENKYDVELNYPFSRCALDIALFIDNYKVNIEYDCEYWHDKIKDRKRDEFLKSNGWKIIRILGGHKLPTLKQLVEKIDNVKEYNFQVIIVEEWREKYYE